MPPHPRRQKRQSGDHSNFLQQALPDSYVQHAAVTHTATTTDTLVTNVAPSYFTSDPGMPSSSSSRDSAADFFPVDLTTLTNHDRRPTRSSSRRKSTSSVETQAKRHRALRACERCKQRKQKCDNAFPRCGNCVKGEADCYTPDDPMANTQFHEEFRALQQQVSELTAYKGKLAVNVAQLTRRLGQFEADNRHLQAENGQLKAEAAHLRVRLGETLQQEEGQGLIVQPKEEDLIDDRLLVPESQTNMLLSHFVDGFAQTTPVQNRAQAARIPRRHEQSRHSTVDDGFNTLGPPSYTAQTVSDGASSELAQAMDFDATATFAWQQHQGMLYRLPDPAQHWPANKPAT